MQSEAKSIPKLESGCLSPRPLPNKLDSSQWGSLQQAFCGLAHVSSDPSFLSLTTMKRGFLDSEKAKRKLAAEADVPQISSIDKGKGKAKAET